MFVATFVTASLFGGSGGGDRQIKSSDFVAGVDECTLLGLSLAPSDCLLSTTAVDISQIKGRSWLGWSFEHALACSVDVAHYA